MRSFRIKVIGIFLSTVAFSSHLQAQSLPASEFVGMYTQGGADTEGQLFLLGDQTFCFTFTGGSLDILKAGRWKKTAAGSTINLIEQRPDAELYPAVGMNMDRLGPPTVAITIDGYSMSNARTPVLAISSTDTLPTTFRPLFPIDKNNWPGTYSLPLMTPEKAKYFFIGDVEVNQANAPTKLRITQYKIENYDTVRVGFNQIQATPAMNSNAELIHNVLEMDGQKFGVKRSLSSGTITGVRKQCINPILFPQKGSAAQAEAERKLPNNAETLKPINNFTVNVAAMVGDPIFGDGDTTATQNQSSLSDLIETEQDKLRSAFGRADGDSELVGEFLQLAKNLSRKKRVNVHAPLMVKLYGELLAAKVGKAEHTVAREIFINFMENIYPIVHENTDAEMRFDLANVASQALNIAITVKDPDIDKMVFEKVLGKEFDINKEKNFTLVFNLACYYALKANKTAMLIAVKQARKLKLPTKLFVEEADFRNYAGDADFLHAIK